MIIYQNDHLGTPQKLTSVSGAVVWSAKYGSFGKAEVDASSTITNTLRFGGQYEDAESGLHYNRWRYYDPENGRYLRPDPIGLKSGVNLFTYASNKPTNAVDPFGLDAIGPIWGPDGLGPNPSADEPFRGLFPGQGPEWHHDRNSFQRCPREEPCEADEGWNFEGRMPTHGGYRSYRGRGENRGFQCVYDDMGDLMEDRDFYGTYDYSPPYNDDGTVNIPGLIDHFIVDVTPWILYGN